jgi:CxxC motif-containing protein
MKELLCIVCPNGCRLTVEETDDGLKVSGNRCNRGISFAQAELTHPTRTVTSTVRTGLPGVPVLPVRTSGEIPKGMIPDLMVLLSGVTVREPVGIGEAVVKNALGLGIDVIATSNMLKEPEAKIA